MSSNFIKARSVIREEEVRVIQSNDLVSKKLENLTKILKDDIDENFPNGFMDGIDAKQVEVLLNEDKEAVDDYEKPDLSEAIEGRLQEAQRAYEDKIATAKEEADIIIEKARKEANFIREEAKANGLRDAQNFLDDKSRENEEKISKKLKELECKYAKMEEELEPKFVEVITGIYEHVFNVQLEDYHDLVVHLINRAMSGSIEAGKNYLIHVSKADFPYVSMKKKELVQGTGVNLDAVEIVEDFSMGRGQCLIETGGGIFDCGLGTQMERLNRELRLLSYGND